MTHMPEFHHGLSAEQAHTALKSSVEIMDRAHHCAVLWFGEIMRRKLYRALGFSTMRAYALEALGFSATRAGDFIRLVRKLDTLPAVKKEMVAGRIGYTKAREIASVADSRNEHVWVKEAKEKSRRELVATVKQAKTVAKQVLKANPGQIEMIPSQAPTAPPVSVPIRVSFELTTLQNARLEAMLAKIGQRGSRADLLLDAVEALLDAAENAPRGATAGPRANPPHYQVHVHQCPDCHRNTVPTPQGERELTAVEAEIVSCDARIHTPGERNTTTIPPKTWSLCVPLVMICGTNKTGTCSRC